MTKAEKILEASQVALERAGVVAESAMKAAMEDWLEALPKPAVKEFFGVQKKFPNPKDKKTVDAKNLEILKKYKVKPLIGDPSHRESLGALSCCLDMLGESAEKQGDSLVEGKAVKIGRLTFESFTNGSISGWWVKHITVVQGQGVWKPNTLGWIEERKSTKTSVIPSFLWLEKGNGEENTKALIVWPKGSAPVAGANVVVASNPGTGGLLQAVAKWIQERRPDLVKEETVEPKLTEAQKIIEASQVALGRAGVLSEEKQAPRITEKMIRDDMGLGQSDIGKGALVIERSGWCANCNKAWYAVVFLAKNRVWWGEISAGDRHATYTNMGKLNLHNAAFAKFDAPGKWKDTTGQKYTPVTN